MRYFLRRAALPVLGLAMASCTDLTETPYSQVTETNIKPSVGSLIAPAYSPLRDVWMGWYGNLDFQEETADALLTPVRPNGWYDGGTYIKLHKHQWDAAQGQPASLWGNAFRGINGINRIVYQITSGAVPVKDSLKPGLLAELRALRAYYYSLLLDAFGNVPIVTDFTSTDLPQQNTRQQVYDFVVAELTAALPNLSTAKGKAMYGRMNRWAAEGILARVYLNAEVYTGTPQYDKVILLTQAIIDSGDYKMEAQYRANFARTNDKSVETGACSGDYPSIRYEDVLMMQADALLRTGQADAAALLRTKVRRQAFVSADSERATMPGTNMMVCSRYNYGWYDPDGVVKTGP